VAAFDKWQADAVVIERNQGGDLVRENLHTIRPGLPVIEVHATRGKHVRAEPISSLYSLGRISHVGTFPDLEDQMCLMTAGGFEGEGSPDRCDALVWALTELFPQMTVSRYEDELDTFDEHYQDRSAVGGY
jgi:phage terminase large subunit-like protein